jgi:hypothetical protein
MNENEEFIELNDEEKDEIKIERHEGPSGGNDNAGGGHNDGL